MTRQFISKYRILGVLSLIILLMLFTGCQTNNNTNKIRPTDIPQIIQTPIKREGPYYKEIEMNKSMRAPLYNVKYEKNREAFKVEKDMGLGMQFYAVTDFNTLSVHCLNYDNMGVIKFTLFKWQPTYDKTIKGEPIYIKEFKDFENDTWIDFVFPTLPEDEYVLYIENIAGSVGVWHYNKALHGIRLYNKGFEMNGYLEVEIEYIHSPDVVTAELSPNIWESNGLEKVPDEIVVDKDHPIAKLNVKPDTWTAIDGLGRTLPDYKDVGAKKDKYVGMFYWTWHNPEASYRMPRDLTKIINEYPEASKDYYHSVWQEYPNAIYYWEEPIYGYYLATDEYVYRKHAELLADAGVDVVFFDTTNVDYLWVVQYEALCEAWLKARQDGVNTPKISFLMNFHDSYESRVFTLNQLEEVYTILFKPRKYQDLWFYWEGKPLLMARYEDLDLENPLHIEIKNFFTFRPGNPYYFTPTLHDDQWGWLSVYPQTKYGVDKKGNVEQMCVSVSQNANDNGIAAMNDVGIYGRAYAKGNYSYTYKYKGKDIIVDKNIKDGKLYGLNFQQQWDYALDNDPKFVWVTGWNERRVDRYKTWGGIDNAFPDQFNDEFSRDIEPTTGVLKDNYYYQLVANVRKFKGMEKPDSVNAKKTITLDKGLEQWEDVMPEFNHYTGNTPDRDINGVHFSIMYENHTMRNDIIQSKVAYDNKNIYFMVKTVENITPYTDNAWMRLFIDTDTSDRNWESFEYVINRVNPTTDKCVIERSIGGFEWEIVGEVEYSVTDNFMQLVVPRSMIGKESDTVPEFNFKWADNTQNDGDIMDFYLNGDVAPGGRFKFAFRAEQKSLKDYRIVIAIGAILVIVGILVVLRKKRNRDKDQI